MIIRPILQSIVEDIDFDELPSNWNLLDIKNFSKSKKLYKFQQNALKNAIKTLYLYFKEDNANKSKFYKKYKLNGLNEDLEKTLDIKISKKDILSIVEQYYPIENQKLKFQHLINRASFWMATGSGKTLLIIKLVEILKMLMDLNEIPKKDILILTHRDDLINQLKKHVDEFNELSAERGFKIHLFELTEYDKIKNENLMTYFNEIPIFYYRSDLISDEQKEKIIDFKNYDNNGDWYIILDEAHKGDKEDSKRQMLYSIMSRNGFLFNFSATFTDPRDIVTTAYNFNLERFIKEGYGKHIYILKQEMRAFKEKEDYNDEEKQKIVLKSLILLTYIKKIREKIKETAKNIYHEPLLLTLVNTVNLSKIKEEKPDLILFFNELEKIGKGNINNDIFEKAKEELIKEFSEKPNLIYEDEPINIHEDIIKSITIEDILKYVYNSESFGEIEVITIPKKSQEAIFKLKTSDKPFALIRIGDAIKWIKENLKGYNIEESYDDKSIFENLDEREDISILMGSRAFYEGWDSNRPNIILFINIGKRDAKKFVIQSVGRGVRIEPIKGKRRRLKFLYNTGEDNGLFEKISNYIQPIETLFIFGTNRKALSEVISSLKVEKLEETIKLAKNENAEKYNLLIPIFKESTKKLYQEGEPQKFEISKGLFDAIDKYFNSFDDRIIIVQNNITPETLSVIRESLKDKDKYYKFVDSQNIPLNIAIQKLISHFNLNIEEFDKFKQLEDEIIHFKKIKVFLNSEDEIKELKQKIDKVINYENIPKDILEKQLFEDVKAGKISFEDFQKELEKIKTMSKEEQFKDLKIKHILNHYYIPIILSEKEKIDYITHIIKTKSEVKFIEDLEKYIANNEIDADWWMFSKIDEHLDEVYIPYYDPDKNKIRKFKPDFIFWIKKGNNYFIIFADPKSSKYTDYEHKVDWFKKYFEENGEPKEFEFDGIKIKVMLYLYTEDVNKLSEGYKKFWLDDVSKIFKL
ncbi:hypothetical protein JH146_0630 [Methanocaldococcus bathoardescens]|uniref:Helicase ATP-binding domain-containing protein n=1 Tax=Methanocaldococcus bathoardescens TaxID=1301915 RepID=A0A076LIX7_9EURY|nr:DEAD/DEAH box helicase family protein [Methanocaldococcus bathoardescens]AIJ05479.1 hypothetical protein JH146_0630 [Methanocaldococcus bathoardescens]